MSDILVQHVRNSSGRKIATLVAKKEIDHLPEGIIISCSKCKANDRFNSNTGREIALLRIQRYVSHAEHALPTKLIQSSHIKKCLEFFIGRSQRYFKTQQVKVINL